MEVALETKEDLAYLFKNYLKSKGNVRSYKNLKLALEADIIFEQTKKLVK
jgi:hypothetical protein